MTRVALCAVALLLLGCEKTDANARACPETIATYCASSPCVLHIDLTIAVASYCASNPADKEFGTAGCGDAGFQIQAGVTFQYDTSGQLVAVLDGVPFDTSCLAGPPTFELPSECRSGLIAFICGSGDAGTD